MGWIYSETRSYEEATIWNCPKCHKTIAYPEPTDTDICFSPDEPDYRYCPYCGKSVGRKTKFKTRKDYQHDYYLRVTKKKRAEKRKGAK